MLTVTAEELAAPGVVAPPEPPALEIPRHPALAALAAALVVFSFARYGLGLSGLAAAVGCASLAVLSVIDARHRLLPNRIVLGTWVAVLALHALDDPASAAEGLTAGLAAAAFLAFPLLLNGGAMGLGDVKLALLLGALVGWGVFGAIVLGCFAIVPFAVAIVVRGGSVRTTMLPFGPFLAFGTVVVLLSG